MCTETNRETASMTSDAHPTCSVISSSLAAEAITSDRLALAQKGEERLIETRSYRGLLPVRSCPLIAKVGATTRRIPKGIVPYNLVGGFQYPYDNLPKISTLPEYVLPPYIPILYKHTLTVFLPTTKRNLCDASSFSYTNKY